MSSGGPAYRYGVYLKQEDFKLHLDVFHFATIEEKNFQISVICTLCEHPTNTLTEHKLHLTQKHPYVFKYIQNSSISLTTNKPLNLQAMLSVRQVKSKVKEIENSSQIVILRSLDQHKLKVKYQNREYEVYKYQKEYHGMEYDESQVYSELILAPIILNGLYEAKYFVINKTPLETTIKCEAFILCEIVHGYK